jgi:flagellar motor switch protein FliG
MTELDNLRGAKRVAAFLVSLDKDTAAAILQKLDPAVVADVAEALTSLDAGSCAKETLDAVWRELARDIHAPSLPRAKNEEELVPFLEAGLGKERSKQVIAAIHERRRHERPFHELEKRKSVHLAAVLAKETPAACALVLAHLEPKLSAEVLSSFDGAFALDVVGRISRIVPPGWAALSAVADDLVTRVDAYAALPAAPDPTVRLKTIAQMLNAAQKPVEKAVLEGLDENDKETAESVREYMFVWDDLARLDKKTMQKVLGSVETRTLAIALKGSAKVIEDNIMNNLSKRVQVMVKDERELAGPMPLTEVLVARNELLKAARALLEGGEGAASAAKGEELVA